MCWVRSTRSKFCLHGRGLDRLCCWGEEEIEPHAQCTPPLCTHPTQRETDTRQKRLSPLFCTHLGDGQDGIIIQVNLQLVRKALDLQRALFGSLQKHKKNTVSSSSWKKRKRRKRRNPTVSGAFSFFSPPAGPSCLLDLPSARDLPCPCPRPWVSHRPRTAPCPLRSAGKRARCRSPSTPTWEKKLPTQETRPPRWMGREPLREQGLPRASTPPGGEEGGPCAPQGYTEESCTWTGGQSG
mmetsp:Transcript_40245/g.104332  ORF Transcript_40245/g.104332 Transcript_40245/m.104332 type:complete len:240 (-) Transcript_40245:1801-2520(-)